jgi:protease IV
MISQTSEKEIISALKEYLKVYKRTNYGKLMLLGGIVALGVIGNALSLFSPSQTHIAVVKIDGEIGADTDVSSGQKIANHILSAINNDDAGIIVIEADSPGGSPTDSQTINELIVKYKDWKGIIPSEVNDEILRIMDDPETIFNQNFKSDIDLMSLARKPIIAVITKQCASACLQAVINADIIIAQRSSLIGNIGVRIDSVNFSELARKVGITNTVITSAKHKDILNPWKSIDNEQVDIVRETLIKPVFEQFKNDVLLARNGKFKIDEDVLFSGLAWTGDDAVKIGLIDSTNNPVIVQASLEKISGTKYKIYSQSSFDLGSLITNPFGQLVNL